MKQSTKLLSLVLALVMAFSCMTVIGNAALVQSELSWDNIDDAQLTAEQVADLALDLVDNDLLAGMDTIDLSILGKLRLNSIDNIFTDICALRASWAWTIGAWLLGDIQNLDFDCLKKEGSWGWLGIGASQVPYQRENGDLLLVGQLLKFIGDDTGAGILSKAAYGIGTDNGVSLGLIGGFLDLGALGDSLANIPNMLVELVYDLLVHGSYLKDSQTTYEYSSKDSYPSLDDLKENGDALPSGMNTLDGIITNVLLNLLINPQDYDYEGEGEEAVKVWNMDSYILPSVKKEVEANGRDAFIAKFNPLNKSLFEILDVAAPYAIYDLAINALNNNLKKTLMEAVEVEFNEIDPDTLPEDVYADFEVDDDVENDGKESYCNYIGYDRIAESNSEWYYTTLENEVVMENGEPVLDEEGNEKTRKERKYFKANTAGANDFYYLIDFNWTFFAPDPTTDESTSADFGLDVTECLNYDALMDVENGGFGSIMESLNHLLYVVFETAVNQETKDNFANLTGEYWVDGATTEIYGNTGKSTIMYNAERLLKYLLSEHADNIFGQSSPYVAWEYSDVENKTITELIAIIGPTFFEDVMPQLIMPKNADGSYAFHDGVQLLEFGALVIREFMTEIAPNVNNYDDDIFAEGTVTTANDRHFKVQSAENWFNIILNMGLDIGATYLIQLTNFEYYLHNHTDLGADFDLEAYVSAGGGSDASHWKAILDYAILWATWYVSGQKTTGVLDKLDYNSVLAVGTPAAVPFERLSYILNTILPLGFVNGCSSNNYEFDVSLLYERAKLLLTNFDLTQLAGLFGRNTTSKYNLLDDAPLGQAILDLVNQILTLVFRKGLLQSTNAGSLDAVISQDNLKTTVYTLLNQLYVNKDAILLNALPVVGKLIRSWGGEQELGKPEVALPATISASGGNLAETSITVRNGSTGVWRHYKDASGNVHKDKQYAYTITDVTVTDIGGTASSTVKVTSYPKTKLEYGVAQAIKFTVTNIGEAGEVVRFNIQYKVHDEDGNDMANGATFTTSKYTYVSYNPSNEGAETYLKKNGQNELYSYSPHYVNTDNVSEVENIITFRDDRGGNAATRDAKITFGTAEGNGFKLAPPQMATKSSTDKKSYTSGGFTVTNEATAAANASGTSAKYTVSYSIPRTALMGGSTASGTADIVLRFYDGSDLSDVSSLANSEANKLRVTEDYYVDVAGVAKTVMADRILTTENTYNEDGTIKEYRESNFTDTVINEDGEEVTVINRWDAWVNYAAAFNNAVRLARQPWNDQSIYTHAAAYEALRVAAADLDWCRLTTEENKLAGAANIDGAVDALKTQVDGVEATCSDTMDYTDYKMYRWNRYNDAINDAKDIINAKKAASLAVADDQYFTYTWISETDLRTLVDGDKYEAYILALLETYTDEEYEEKVAELERAKEHYASYNALDVAQASNLVNRMSQRLLKRGHGVQPKYLEAEIESAKNMIGTTNNGTYTARSWAKYIEAYNEAVAVKANPTQMTAFDAKYNLQVSRNELVKVTEEADYDELEALIAQAEQVLANRTLYANSDKEIGQVLAELGYKDFTNADGDAVQLFPGSALHENSEPYAEDEQYKIDRAATALKEALARLKFKNVAITGANITTEEIVPEDKVNNIPAITASVARIAPERDADAVKSLFTVTGASVDKDNIIVSNDVNYTVETEEEFAFAGTNATVTFYTVVGNVKVPVATVKIVVDADVNGDGALDVLDASLTELTANSHAQLDGCYFIAANLDAASEEIVVADYSAVVDKILA